MVDSPCWGVSTGRFAGVSNVDPTTVTDDKWVWVEPPCAPSQETLGKWLVFKPLEELDETWHMIRRAVESGELDSTGAKCSTACEAANPSRNTMDPSTGVICIYTSEETMDEVGFKLVHMVERDIWYKTDEATLQGKYVATGYRNVSLQIICWNDGNPYLKKHGEAKVESWRGGRDRDDHTMGDWRQGMRDEGERNLPPDEGDSQGGYHYHGRRGYERGSHPQQRSLEDRYDPHGSDGYCPQRRSLEDRSEWGRKSDELPKERPRLQLQPRTKPLEDTSGGRERREGVKASNSIFGQAKPVDTAARDREIEERPLRRGRREVTGHGQMRVESKENGGMREEENMAVVTDGRVRDRLVEGSMTDRSEGWTGEGGIDTQPHPL